MDLRNNSANDNTESSAGSSSPTSQSSHRHSSSRRRRTKKAATSSPSFPTIQNFRLRWIDNEHDECAVCTKQFEINCVVTLLPCGHYFCQSCMDQWFWRIHSSTCPLCRYDVAAGPANDNDNCVVNDDKCCHQPNTTICRRKSAENLNLLTEVVLTGEVSQEKSSSVFNEQSSALGTNFDLIMAKALHARRARLARQWSSSFDSILDDEEWETSLDDYHVHPQSSWMLDAIECLRTLSFRYCLWLLFPQWLTWIIVSVLLEIFLSYNATTTLVAFLCCKTDK